MTAVPGMSRTVELAPAAELEHARLAAEIPGFEEAYAELIAAIDAGPRRGRPMVGGRWARALANRGRPRVRVVYTFNETGIRVRDIHATRAEYLPSATKD
ncbi:MAG: hypothetical protein OXI22_15405 [Defluviicoccus sp.]|nr:hypothetical protein [Defluviicoccus sp.]